MKKTVLILAANPTDTRELGLRKEISEIQQVMEGANVPWSVYSEPAAQSRNLRKLMLAKKPCVVHFSGHGEGEDGITLEDHSEKAAMVSTEALGGLFKLFSDHLQCVVLNACYAEVQADVICEHVKYVIGMKGRIDDCSAIAFSRGFYTALAAGESFERAFEHGCSEIQMANLPDDQKPVLKTRKQKPVETAPAFKDFASSTVFLAETPDDLSEERRSVKAFLEQHNVTVLPDSVYVYPSQDALQKAMDADLGKCQLFVQVLNRTVPERPPGMTTPLLQYDRAKTLNLPVLQWREKRLDVSGIKDESLRSLITSPDAKAMSLEDFKPFVLRELTRIRETSAQPPNPVDDYVFINSNNIPEDLELAQEIGDVLKSEGIPFWMAVHEGYTVSQKRRELEDKMKMSEAMILLYFRTSQGWVDEQLRLYFKKRRKRPMKIIAICDKPTGESKPQVPAHLSHLEILHCPDLHVETCLPKFLKEFRR